MPKKGQKPDHPLKNLLEDVLLDNSNQVDVMSPDEWQVAQAAAGKIPSKPMPDLIRIKIEEMAATNQAGEK
ncbi:MAG: hypothetical protein WC310_02275 [Patescibacteria group bacterium]|jgi:hypothetical protein